MSARVYVAEDWQRDKVNISVAIEVTEGHTKYLRWGEPIVSTIDINQEAPSDATLALTPEIARALHEALSRYFGGSPDATNLRKDYNSERARVDKFIAHLTEPSV